jgi:hypothetical protein
VVGSFGRLEASRESDFDFFVLAENPNERAESVANDVRQLIIEKGIKPPSKGGAFSTVQGSDSMVTQIGGDQDDNQSITRRILFLLEAQTLLNKKFTASVLEAIIGRYIKEKITDHQLALFFLNDVIRYYRTVCVDFEFKTSNLNKEWGLRNIKLVFSRKLIYFSGVLMAAEGAQASGQRKRDVLFQLSQLTPVQRLLAICGDRADDVLRKYNSFLESLAKPEVRKVLLEVKEDNRYDFPIFRELKNTGHHFSWALLQLLRADPRSC